MSAVRRWHQLVAQRAYERRVAARGLPALLEPYGRPRLRLLPGPVVVQLPRHPAPGVDPGPRPG